MIRYLSLFSGIEAASVACCGMEWEPLAFAEIDAFPSAVLKERFPYVPNLGDVTQVNWRSFVKDFGKPDIIVGGSPCQSFSIAGTRTGLEGASGLMWGYVRAVRDVRPEWVLWENVPGALSSTHGEDFGCLLRSLDALGYGMAWRVLDAQFFGVAQRRERVFLVGRLGSRPPVEVLFEPEGVRWNPKPSREKRKELAGAAGRGPAREGFKYSAGSRANSVGCDEESPNTITADWHDSVVIGFAQNTRDEVRVQGDGTLSGALSASPGMKQQTYVAVVRGSLCAAGSCDVDNQLMDKDEAEATDGTVACMTDTQANASHNEELCGTLTSHAMKDAPVVTCGDVRQHEWTVRRLTPRECERLQGFPDDWTRIPYRGKPADECPDGPRYRAIGNSMAVPVMRWIFERIEDAMSSTASDEAPWELKGGVIDAQ